MNPCLIIKVSHNLMNRRIAGPEFISGRPEPTVCETRTSSLTTREAIRLCAVLLYKGFKNFPVDVRNSYVSRLVAGYDFVTFVIPCHAP